MSGFKVKHASEDAQVVLDRFISDHRQAAIPAMIGTCVVWAVQHGGAAVVKQTLRNAIKLVDDLDRDRRTKAS